MSSEDAIIRRLLGDRHIVHVALAHAGVGDAHEPGPCSHLLDTVAAGVAHSRAQSAGEVIRDPSRSAFVGYPPLDPRGHGFSGPVGGFLKMATARAERV